MKQAQASAATRAERRAAILAEQRAMRHQSVAAAANDQRRRARLRTLGFGLVAILVLGGGAALAFGDLFGQRGSPTTAGTIPVQMSMAGFGPSEIRIKAGQTAYLELWTTDAAPHLQGGVHTMISDELGIYEELPAAGPTGESRRMVAIQAPMQPGTYDIYCNTCCGGKGSPTMHGKLVVEA